MNKQALEYERVKEKIAIFLVARDDEISLEEAVIMWDAWKRAAAERGHFGDCTNEPETCFSCLVDSTYEDADTILTIKNIAILSDEQSLPDLNLLTTNILGVPCDKSCHKAEQHRMLGAGFVKVVKEV